MCMFILQDYFIVEAGSKQAADQRGLSEETQNLIKKWIEEHPEPWSWLTMLVFNENLWIVSN